ncbi:MAG: hypothetical protein HWE24_20975 [Oceanospirillaceae bacterium]|nr:hypothetical protein [Oceanospirillaceae bacterium]
MNNINESDIPIDFWIETVEGRAKSMNVELLKKIGAYSVEEVGMMHYEEYSNRLLELSKKEKIDFAKSRMKGFADAYNHFVKEYDKIKDNRDKDKKLLEHYIFHADASFIGAQLIAEANGMKSNEIVKYIPNKKIENAIDDILSSLETESNTNDSFNIEKSEKNSQLLERRVFLRDTAIKLIYTILASIFLYIVYLFYVQYRRSTNIKSRSSSNQSRGARR